MIIHKPAANGLIYLILLQAMDHRLVAVCNEKNNQVV